MAKGRRYFIIHKPEGMLSQFSPQDGYQTLADLEFEFPKDAYPVGRLDADSEGLLIITNDKSVNHRLLDPSNGHQRTYWVQLEGAINKQAIASLKEGVEIQVKGETHKTLPAEVKKMGAPKIADRIRPVVFNKSKGNSWIKLSLTEGKNRQVRKMTSAVGFPTIRLIRWSIEGIELGTMPAGEVMELTKPVFYKKVKLEY